MTAFFRRGKTQNQDSTAIQSYVVSATLWQNLVYIKLKDRIKIQFNET